jgi:DNA polymerase-1
MRMGHRGVGVDQERQSSVKEALDVKAMETVDSVRAAIQAIPSRRAVVDALRREADALEDEAAPLDVPGSKRAAGKLRTQARKKREAAQALIDINLNRDAQLRELLFEHMALPTKRRTKITKEASVDDDVLVELARVAASLKTKQQYGPVINDIRTFNTVSKLSSTYCAYEDDILHPSWLVWGTAAGRLSCRDPNLQNIPKRDSTWAADIRSMFVPTVKGWMFTAADYKQIERRIQAVLANDRELLHAFANGVDCHTFTAARIFKVAMDDVSFRQRYLGKRAVFGESYGMGYLKFQRMLAAEGIFLTPQEAKTLLAALADAHPEIAARKQRLVDLAHRERMLRNPFKRIRWFLDPNVFGEAINFEAQSTAADVMLGVMPVVDEQLPKPARIVMQIHDQLVVEHPPDIEDQVRECLKDVMETRQPEMNGWFCPVDVSGGATLAQC